MDPAVDIGKSCFPWALDGEAPATRDCYKQESFHVFAVLRPFRLANIYG